MVQARTTLWLMIFSGLAVNYMLRVNINITILSMARTKPHIHTLNSNVTFPSNILCSEDDPKCNNEIPASPIKMANEYTLDEYQQNLVLGSYFWLHWLSTLPGGILSHHYGTKLVFGLSNCVTGLVTLLIPAASKLDYRLVIIARVVQGFFSGLGWPSMHYITSQWSTPSNRGKFVSAYVSGASAGAAITFPFCGLIINYFGWEFVFYITGIITVFWCIVWSFLVYDSPKLHPFISTQELRKIEKSQSNSISSGKLKVPWKHILTSWQVLLCSMAQWGVLWGVYTLSTQMPTYLESIHKLNVKLTGAILGAAQVIKVIFAFVFGAFTDLLLMKGYISLINVRKLSTSVCTIVSGLFLIGLVFYGSSPIIAIVLIILANACQAASSSGQISSFVDMSPNFSSITLGICATIGSISGFVSPLVVGNLTLHNQTEEQWKKVFLISGSATILPGIIYMLFGRSELQKWNSESTSERVIPEEQVTLKS